MRDSCGLAAQVLAVLLFILVVILIWDNLTYNLRQLGIRLGFDLSSRRLHSTLVRLSFLQSVQQLCSSHVGGTVQLLRVIVLGLILTTILGLIAGLPVSPITG